MSQPKPLEPPATEAEKNRAAELWTNANDDLVARGYARSLWGNLSRPAQEQIVLILRAAGASNIV
jgi:hypothetical protein